MPHPFPVHTQSLTVLSYIKRIVPPIFSHAACIYILLKNLFKQVFLFFILMMIFHKIVDKKAQFQSEMTQKQENH